jgi:hypothetical protein
VSGVVVVESANDLLALDPDWDGTCACAHVIVGGTYLDIHCYRVDLEHEGNGIHYVGDRETAQLAKAMLETDWPGEWFIVEGRY